jgi:hypothetical protein
VDLGDQFIAFQKGRVQGPDDGRHFRLVVNDKEAVRAALSEADIAPLPGPFLDFLDPWGNRIEIVRGMGLRNLSKNDSAHARAHIGLAAPEPTGGGVGTRSSSSRSAWPSPPRRGPPARGPSGQPGACDRRRSTRPPSDRRRGRQPESRARHRRADRFPPPHHIPARTAAGGPLFAGRGVAG